MGTLSLLEIRGLTKRFGGLTAVNSVSFDVDEKEILGIIGPNGSGKTTTFNLICGFYRPDEGTIKFKGKDIAGLKPHVICHKGIARTFQLTRIFSRMTVFDNLMVGIKFAAKTRSREEVKHIITRILENCGLLGKKDIVAGSLTLAERRRLEIARALATEPELILLDEVAAGLNPTECMEVVKLLNDIRRSGITILMIEHIMGVIMNLSDRIIVLNYGRKIAEGSPKEIASNDEVIKAYLGERTHA